MDESFNRFLEMKRGAAMHTLESLMLLPVSESRLTQFFFFFFFSFFFFRIHVLFSSTSQVQRIYEYHKLLLRLYSLTPKDHPDYHDLRYTITCVGSVCFLPLFIPPSFPLYPSLHAFFHRLSSHPFHFSLCKHGTNSSIRIRMRSNWSKSKSDSQMIISNSLSALTSWR